MLALILMFPHLAWAAFQCDSKDTGQEEMIERINKRYDDFFRHQRMEVERTRDRQKDRGQNHRERLAHEAQMERARLAYLKSHRAAPDQEAKMEAEMEKRRKERNAANEAARSCYVQSQLRAEKLLKRGRMIPGNLEYHLED